MSKLLNSRGLRALACLPVFVLLVAARSSVSPMPETMVATTADFPIGEEITVREGDVILRANVFETQIATVNEPVSVSIARFSHDIEAGTKLDPVIVSSETRRVTGTSGFIYCGENQRTRSQFAEAMIGDWFSKYETIVRFCFVDSDNDGKLDQVFLAGAKDKEEQAAVAIEPVAFERRMFRLTDAPVGTLELRVNRLIRKRNQPDKIEFKLVLLREGVPFGFDFILTVDGKGAERTYPLYKTDPQDVPYPSYYNDILGAGIGIMSVDAEQGTAQVKVNRNFAMQLFKPVSIQYNYVYVYY